MLIAACVRPGQNEFDAAIQSRGDAVKRCQ
jgi:hypothetical protein